MGSKRKPCYARKCQEPLPNITGGKGQKGRPQGWRKDGNHVSDYKRLVEEKDRLKKNKTKTCKHCKTTIHINGSSPVTHWCPKLFRDGVVPSDVEY